MSLLSGIELYGNWNSIIRVPRSPNIRISFLQARESTRVDAIYHRAVIEVDEEGTTAAAATAMTRRFTSYRAPVVLD